MARGAGLRVSAAEGIDAARAVDLVGFADRVVLKDTLGLILAKTPDEKALYDEAFELYFKRDEFAGKEQRRTDRHGRRTQRRSVFQLRGSGAGR